LLYIVAEFKIRSATERIKDLADALNEFLIQKKLEGKKVAVFIDDAHKLNSEVLEQVRLISNLETSKDKLLQLVLIGEPKLSEMLNSNELRQIGQRVSVGYRIGPLTQDETVGYIQHRLTIASKGPPIRFDRKAVRRIFKYSRGIPRNINVACTQALEIAYKQKLKIIEIGIAKAAIRHLNDRAETEETKSRNRRLPGSIAAICCLIIMMAMAVVFFRYNSDDNFSKEIITQEIPAATGQTTEIPARPVLPSLVNPEPPAIKEDLSIEPIQADPAETSVPPSDSPAPGLRSSPKMTHSVQVGAFRRIENAEELIGWLKAKGYSARTVQIPDLQGQLWFTVKIGDYPTLETAEEQARIFREDVNMGTFIRPYKAD
jgi:general secretion pathway protein A